MNKIDKIRTIRIKQNSQEFLFGVLPIEKILKFTRYTERSILTYSDNNIPIYNDNVQRKLNNAKVQRIADYLIHDSDALFPTNILLAVPEIIINSIEERGIFVDLKLDDIVADELSKEDGYIYISIIDGQHRIKGIEIAIERMKLAIEKSPKMDPKDNDVKNPEVILERLKSFTLLISFFIDPILEYQAMLFSIINRTQTKVSEDLVYSLFGVSSMDSAPKSILSMVLALNANYKSPFYNRVRLAGAKYNKGESPPFSQSMMVKSILKLITKFPREFEIERNKNREYFIENPNENLPFRIYYGENKDSEILKIILAYFNSIRSSFKKRNGDSYWDLSTSTNILQTTVGYEALILLLKDILLKEKNIKNLILKDFYENILKDARNLNFEDKERYPFTSVSKTYLYNDFKEKLKIYFA